MVLPSSGAISYSQMQTEFGGSNPISMTEYYGKGTLPSSGTIKASNFHGQSAGIIINYNVTTVAGQPLAYGAGNAYCYYNIGSFPTNIIGSNGARVDGLIRQYRAATSKWELVIFVSNPLPAFKMTNVSNGAVVYSSALTYTSNSNSYAGKAYANYNYPYGATFIPGAANYLFKYEEV